VVEAGVAAMSGYRFKMTKVDKDLFIYRLQGMIDHQVRLYWQDPKKYIEHLPIKLSCHFSERHHSNALSLAFGIAVSLIATHRVPRATYVWRMMNNLPNEDGSKFQPHTDLELVPILEYTPDVMRPDLDWALVLNDDSEPSPF
jgi:hypothetical protein